MLHKCQCFLSLSFTVNQLNASSEEKEGQSLFSVEPSQQSQVQLPESAGSACITAPGTFLHDPWACPPFQLIETLPLVG